MLEEGLSRIITNYDEFRDLVKKKKDDNASDEEIEHITEFREFLSNFRTDLNQFLESETNNSNIYTKTTQAPFDNWPYIPWVGILNKNVTTTAKKGFYVVYLFDKNRKGVYLSLNQGTNELIDNHGLDEALEILESRSMILRNTIEEKTETFDLDKIELFGDNDNSKSYEKGNIMAKYYSLNDLDERLLLSDLKEMLVLYEYLIHYYTSIITSEEETLDWIVESSNVDDVKLILTEFEDIKDLSSREIIDKLDSKYNGKPQFEKKVVNAIKRPSPLSNAIKEEYGYECMICGYPGFEKKSGGKYAEVHHMIELNKKAPKTLQSWNLIVLCPTCHKKLHYSDVNYEWLNPGWKITLEDKDYFIRG